MGRRRRQINDRGELLCPGCGAWVFITDYYFHRDTPTWYIVDGVEFKKPLARCKACCTAANQSASTETAVQSVTPGVLAREMLPASAGLTEAQQALIDQFTSDEALAALNRSTVQLSRDES